MTIIDLKPVRRCGNCNHLIPASMADCPYCSQRAFVNRPEAEPEPEPEASQFEMPSLSPKAKKGIIIGMVVAAVLIVIVLIWQFVAGMLVLNKSILEPLDDKTVISEIQKDPTFADFYENVCALREYIISEEDKAKYEDITYNDFRDYYDTYSSELYCNDVRQKAEAEYDETMMAPMQVRIDSVKHAWETFIDEHNIEKYITVTTHNMFYGHTYEYHPAWYYIVNNPGGVVDCEADVEFSGGWDSVALKATLSEMKASNSADNLTYLTSKYAYDDNYWDNHNVTVNIKSITLRGGTVIKSTDMEQVPQAVTMFMSEDNEYSRQYLINETIDPNFPNKQAYALEAVKQNLKEKNEHCYELIERVDMAAGYPIVRRGF